MSHSIKSREDTFDVDEVLVNEGLSAKFRMSDLTKFDGVGDPKMHLRQYLVTMSTTGLRKAQKGLFCPSTTIRRVGLWKIGMP